jgi:hypothetical protein
MALDNNREQSFKSQYYRTWVDGCVFFLRMIDQHIQTGDRIWRMPSSQLLANDPKTPGFPPIINLKILPHTTALFAKGE